MLERSPAQGSRTPRQSRCRARPPSVGAGLRARGPKVPAWRGGTAVWPATSREGRPGGNRERARVRVPRPSSGRGRQTPRGRLKWTIGDAALGVDPEAAFGGRSRIVPPSRAAGPRWRPAARDLDPSRRGHVRQEADCSATVRRRCKVRQGPAEGQVLRSWPLHTGAHPSAAHHHGDAALPVRGRTEGPGTSVPCPLHREAATDDRCPIQ